jgi:class 3 adenylate cyclase
MSDPIHFESETVLGIPPADLWPLLADTDRLNRTLDLPPVAYALRADASGSRLEASARTMGITLRWREHPFEWIEGQRYEVLREFMGGPIASVRGGVELAAVPEGTRVKAFADVIPRGWLGRFVAARAVGPKATTGLLRSLKAMEAYAKGESRDPFPRPERVMIGTGAYNAAAARLTASGADPVQAGRLLAHVRVAHDEDVASMRPYAVADAWGTDRLQTLKTFLHAARAGLLDLSWEVLCPNCRVSKASVPTLSALKPSAHCETCRIAFDGDFARHVELRFAVNPAIRDIRRESFCIGGPGNTPHVLVQLRFPGPGERKVILQLGAGRYRARAIGLQAVAELDVAPGASAADAGFRVAADGVTPARIRIPPGLAAVHVVSEVPGGAVFVLERERWTDQAATAAQVTALPEFRDLFSAEVLAPGVQVGVRRLALLFTDLQASTALYARVGDAEAFGLVRRHFDLLEDAIVRHRGGIVKTIGDAVMASFLSEADAVRAALEMQRRFPPFAGERGAAGVALKVGVHAGPCIAMEANGRNDYFGGTVNIAARVQGESGGGEIVLTEEVYRAGGVEEALNAERAVIEAFEARLKGLPEGFRLRRVRLGQVVRA